MLTINPLIARLGYAPDARLVIFHADDVGMCHGSNQAFLDLLDAGIVKCGSIMAPCPWAPEILDYCAANPQVDVGVHLTLNSEWSAYRWGPVGTRDATTGLVDPHGYFWQSPAQTQAALNTEAAVAELRAQLELVRMWGVDFTHIDTHMGAALHPALFPAYIELGIDYGVPVLMLRQLSDTVRDMGFADADDAEWAVFVAGLEARGMALVDHFGITPGYGAEESEGGRAELYETMLRNLPPGITYISLHPNAPGDIEAISPDRGHWRTFEAEYFRSARLHAFLAQEAIIPIGYREIRDALRIT
jgi:predicted glycoside hydrolase/deacetylase ChbG (UPF0249 family)